jgi:hypothetical protein
MQTVPGKWGTFENISQCCDLMNATRVSETHTHAHTLVINVTMHTVSHCNEDSGHNLLCVENRDGTLTARLERYTVRSNAKQLLAIPSGDAASQDALNGAVVKIK